MFQRIKNFFDNIPNYIINLITVISVFTMPITFIIELILKWLSIKEKLDFKALYFILFLCLIAILIIRVIKYHKLLHSRMKIVSVNFMSFLKKSQSLYFDVMKLHKCKQLTVELLTEKYKIELVSILNCLCEIMKSYTGREVSACIKIINYTNRQNKINLDRATVSTFCRSENSIGRGDYENYEEPIFIKKNTDFREIVDNTINTGKSYFYVQDLEKYNDFLLKNLQFVIKLNILN